MFKLLRKFDLVCRVIQWAYNHNYVGYQTYLQYVSVDQEIGATINDLRGVVCPVVLKDDRFGGKCQELDEALQMILKPEDTRDIAHILYPKALYMGISPEKANSFSTYTQLNAYYHLQDEDMAVKFTSNSMYSALKDLNLPPKDAVKVKNYYSFYALKFSLADSVEEANNFRWALDFEGKGLTADELNLVNGLAYNGDGLNLNVLGSQGSESAEL